MSYCEYCKVHVSTKTEQCPLCKRQFHEEPDGTETESYPPFVPLKRKRHVVTRIFAFLIIVSIGTCAIVNWFTFGGSYWSVIVAACVLYAWLLTQFTFMTRINLGLKLLTHSVAIPLLLVVINTFARPGAFEVSWALAYATPFIIMAFTLAITITVAVSPMRFRDYTIYQLSIALIGFVPLVLLLVLYRLHLPGMPIWPSVVAAFYSLLTLVSMFIFMDKRTKTELRRRFHFK